MSFGSLVAITDVVPVAFGQSAELVVKLEVWWSY